MDLLGSAGDQQPIDPAELLWSHYRGEGILDADRFGLVLGPGAPDQGAGVGLVGEHGVDIGLEPPLAAGGGDAFGIQVIAGWPRSSRSYRTTSRGGYRTTSAIRMATEE